MVGGWLGSVRTRVTLGAVLAVAVALVIVGVVIIRMTAATMISDAQNAAEVQARNLAIVVEAGRVQPTLDVDASGTIILQVVGEEGEVMAASPQLVDVAALGETIPEVGHGIASTVRIATWTGQETDYRVVAVGAASPSGTVAVFAGVSLTEAEHVLGHLTRLLFGGLVVVLLVVAGVSWLVTGWALRPVDAIREEVDKLSDQHLDLRVPVPAHQDEVHRLALTMNRMLERLQAATDRQRAFIADASHELRSPLASLRTQLEVAAAHPEAFDTAELVRDTLADALRLEELSTDLLQLAKLDAGATLGVELVNVGTVLSELVGKRRLTEVSVRLEIDENAAVNISRSAFEQVVTNLLDNALRHAESEVLLRVEVADTAVNVTVLDDGAGVPVSDRERVFERFVRLDSSRSRDEGGTGLGLAIARELARAAGGDVSVVDSMKGAAFRLTLPGAGPQEKRARKGGS